MAATRLLSPATPVAASAAKLSTASSQHSKLLSFTRGSSLRGYFGCSQFTAKTSSSTTVAHSMGTQTVPVASSQEGTVAGNKEVLISLSDKTNLEFVAKSLVNLGYSLVSTGGTAVALEKAGIPVKNVEEITSFPEMLDGRVKTLHPNVHGGILARRDSNDHMNALKQWNIGTIDIVIVNLYPFYRTIPGFGNVTFEDGVEKIDIGGPTMIRAAAKNHKDVLVVVDPEDYSLLIFFPPLHVGFTRMSGEWGSCGGSTRLMERKQERKRE